MLRIFTFATDKTKLNYLHETVNMFDSNVECIISETWTGYTDKIFHIQKVIRMIPDNDIVCFIDAYDVLINDKKDDIIQKFKNYNCDLLIGAELNCYPEKYKSKIDEVENKLINYSEYKYPNSGGYIGYAHAIKKLMFWKDKNSIINICDDGGDQSYFIEYYLNNHHNICLDTKCDIFQNMVCVSWKELEFKNGKMYNKVMNTYPNFIHFNGGSFSTENKETIIPVFINQMKLSLNNDTILDLSNYKQGITNTYVPKNQIRQDIIYNIKISNGDRKELINYITTKKKENSTFKVVDIGGTISGWSKDMVDAIIDFNTPVDTKDIIYFKCDITNPNDWKDILEYVKIHGKFDFSICTHTLEDIMNPGFVCEKISQISNEGYIATPSKHRELSRFADGDNSYNNYRGYIHHRWIFTIFNNTFIGFPKINYIENSIFDAVESISNDIEDLSFYWKDSVKVKYLNDNYLGPSVEHVIEYYNKLLDKNYI